MYFVPVLRLTRCDTEMQRVHIHRPLHNPHLHRERHRLELPSLPGLHVHLTSRNRRHAMRPLPTPSLLYISHALNLPMPYLQALGCEYGNAMAEVGGGDSTSTYAERMAGCQSRGQV